RLLARGIAAAEQRRHRLLVEGGPLQAAQERRGARGEPRIEGREDRKGERLRRHLRFAGPLDVDPAHEQADAPGMAIEEGAQVAAPPAQGSRQAGCSTEARPGSSRGRASRRAGRNRATWSSCSLSVANCRGQSGYTRPPTT